MRNHAWNPCTLKTNEKEFHLFLWSWAQVIKMIVPYHFNSLSSKLSLMVPSSMLKQNDELIRFLPCGAEEKQDSTHPILPIFHSQGTLHLPIFPLLDCFILLSWEMYTDHRICHYIVRHSDKTRNHMNCKIVQRNLEQSTVERMGKKGRHRFSRTEKGADVPFHYYCPVWGIYYWSSCIALTASTVLLTAASSDLQLVTWEYRHCPASAL